MRLNLLRQYGEGARLWVREICTVLSRNKAMYVLRPRLSSQLSCLHPKRECSNSKESRDDRILAVHGELLLWGNRFVTSPLNANAGWG